MTEKKALYLLVTLLVLTNIAMFCWLGLREPKVIRAEMIELIDGQGQRRMLLGPSDDGAVSIGMLDRQGRVRLSAGVKTDDQPVIVLHRTDGVAEWGAP